MPKRLVSCIRTLKRGTVFQITIKWLNSNGIRNISRSDIIKIGLYFASNYKKYNCSLIYQKNRQYSKLPFGSNNKRKYIKN